MRLVLELQFSKWGFQGVMWLESSDIIFHSLAFSNMVTLLKCQTILFPKKKSKGMKSRGHIMAPQAG